MKKFYWMILFFFISFFVANGQVFSLLKDIHSGPDGSIFPPFTGEKEKMEVINNIVFFEANDGGEHGFELWKTDGTQTGTVLVKDIFPGSGNSRPGYLNNVNGILFFNANDDVHGRELWKSDGTEAGTVMVKDINPGINSGITGSVQTLSNSNGIVFFMADDGVNGRELWKSDGTEAGTIMVKDIFPGSGFSDPFYMTNINGVVFFIANDGIHGRELWKSDGTQMGTVLVKDIVPGSGSAAPGNVININGVLFFTAYDEVYGDELWKSDGTDAGTVMVKDINSGFNGSLPRILTDVNGTLFFQADDGIHGSELWKSDGTDAGTVMVKDIFPGSDYSYPYYMTNMNGVVFFSATDPINGMGLWKSDGTEAGTVLVKDTRPGSASGYLESFTVINNQLFFYAKSYNPSGNDELWRSDGTEPGTIQVPLIEVNIGDASLHWLFLIGSKLITDRYTSTTGRELWVADLNTNAALPLTLLDFKVQLSGNDGLLNWKTSSEQNTSHFEIERSIDGRNFTKAGTVTASGNSSSEKQYTYTDRSITFLGKPVVYYRLKINDIDGKFTNSRIVAVNISSKEAVIMLYPNPARENTTLMISVTKKENITYSIIDQSGRMLQQKNITVNEGSNTVLVETNSLTAGIYTIVLNGTNTNSRVRFLKQ